MSRLVNGLQIVARMQFTFICLIYSREAMISYSLLLFIYLMLNMFTEVLIECYECLYQSHLSRVFP